MDKKKPNILIRWYRLAEPNKLLWLLQIILYVTYKLFFPVFTILAAQTINCLYSQNWSGAYFFLFLEILSIIIRNISAHFEWVVYDIMYGQIKANVSKKIFNKLISSDSVALNKISKDKIANIAINNMAYICEFPDVVAKFLAYFFQTAIPFVYIFCFNVYAGLVILAIGIINFFVYLFLNKRLANLRKLRLEANDKILKTYNKTLNDKNILTELRSSEKYAEELNRNVHEFNNAYTKYMHLTSYKDNLHFALYYCLIYIVVAFMITLVSKGSLDISVYLVIVPYLKDCSDQLVDVFDNSNNLENMRVDVDRINVILSLTDKEMVKYEQFNQEVQGYNLSLINVSHSSKQGTIGETIKDVDISFKMGGINVIKGQRNSGKRAIFNLLRRYYQPSKGKILLDNLNLYYYNEKTFKNHINYCSSNPAFIDASIKDNLTVFNKDFEKVQEICKKLGIENQILKLNNGYDSNINEIKSKGLLFMLGLVRAAVSNCQILMIYELPENTPESFRNKLIKFWGKYETYKTVIMFTHSDAYDSFANLIYTVEKGKVKIQKR